MSGRPVVRAVLFSGSREVLLNRILNPDTGPVWLTPGGGVNASEDPLKALQREVFEETGIQGIDFIGPVWSCVTAFRFRGETITQHETFYVGYTDKVTLDESGNPDAKEKALSTEFRWWPVSEILRSADSFSPADIGQRIKQFLRLTSAFESR